MIEIRKARDGEEHQVLDFYYQLVDTMKGTPYCPKWEKGVLPGIIGYRWRNRGKHFVCCYRKS